jgi:hypothetical protein
MAAVLMSGLEYKGAPEFQRVSESMERPVYDRRPSPRLVPKTDACQEVEELRQKTHCQQHPKAPPLGPSPSRRAVTSPSWEDER